MTDCLQRLWQIARELGGPQQFVLEDLQRWVRRHAPSAQPGEAGPAFRALRAQGLVNYALDDAARSVYRFLPLVPPAVGYGQAQPAVGGEAPSTSSAAGGALHLDAQVDFGAWLTKR